MTIRISPKARNGLSAEFKLVLTLRFIATGTHYRQMAHNFLVAHETISVAVRQTCMAIWDCLHDEYIRLPVCSDEWKANSAKFSEMWQVPHALGLCYIYSL